MTREQKLHPVHFRQNPGNYPGVGSQFFNAGMIVGAQEQGVGKRCRPIINEKRVYCVCI